MFSTRTKNGGRLTIRDCQDDPSLPEGFVSFELQPAPGRMWTVWRLDGEEASYLAKELRKLVQRHGLHAVGGREHVVKVKAPVERRRSP